MLVSGTAGGEFELSTAPHYSPTGRRIVAVDANEMNERPHDIIVMSSSSHPPKVEYQYTTPEGDKYELWSFVGWEGDNRIKLRAEVHDGRGGVAKHNTEAVLTAKGWQLKRPWVGR